MKVFSNWLAGGGPESPITLSIVLVVYNMRRAAPRSIRSLLTPYQRGIDSESYEIIVVENGSSEPLDKASIESLAPNVRYHYLQDPPPSPAYAINYAVARARGEILAIMVDGAHMVTPGVLRWGLVPFAYESNPIVAAPRFFLGHESQVESVHKGYDEQQEDALLDSIEWPKDGYRLYEVSVPYRYNFASGPPKLFWFVRQFESNCLFVRKAAFLAVGGCDERFDLPGGGCLMPDLYKELCEMSDASIVQLLGEASFHQVHGGISTSSTREKQVEQWAEYTAQYEQIRGIPFEVSQKPQQFVGHMPQGPARRLMLTG
ncbi:glycosyltransferase family 2 protein [Mangrovimicrobium sediminis]|uniref:Glycosyltransferase family 2 protein n=1 Tax=Mangrovimicrobium sediminis TaxID=2562682 RepID=A0A4Z0M636_9GAMM|nr:glycosyltransferase family A protein [Haliea sp. SAOS-164]TGD74886.1 glycosyltransferase family 2 protein [Haliea sp. SAOS-164]